MEAHWGNTHCHSIRVTLLLKIAVIVSVRLSQLCSNAILVRSNESEEARHLLKIKYVDSYMFTIIEQQHKLFIYRPSFTDDHAVT